MTPATPNAIKMQIFMSKLILISYNGLPHSYWTGNKLIPLTAFSIIYNLNKVNNKIETVTLLVDSKDMQTFYFRFIIYVSVIQAGSI